MQTVPLSTPLTVSYVGPSLESGPLPSLLYFALSAQESLRTDPFHQPALFLEQHPIRVFSVDLPYHGGELLATEALDRWAEETLHKESFLSDFLHSLKITIRQLFHAQILIPGQTAVAGLSRGGWIASHVAAAFEEIPILLAFAPLTRLRDAKEFQGFPPSHPIDDLDLIHLSSKLFRKKVRAHIGNLDTRVNTDACYAWIRSIALTGWENKVRSPAVELCIKPSIGYQGHGTSKESFEEGALWIAKALGLL